MSRGNQLYVVFHDMKQYLVLRRPGYWIFKIGNIIGYCNFDQMFDFDQKMFRRELIDKFQEFLV